MTQEERFEKWERDVKDPDTDFRETWHAALEPAELEWSNDESQNTATVCRATGLDGIYRIWRSINSTVYTLEKSTQETISGWTFLIDNSSVDVCKKIAQDHYRLAATRMINKLTGCAE